MGKNYKPEVSPGIKNPDLIDPKNSTHTTEKDGNNADSSDLPAKGTHEPDQPVPPPPELRPEILNTVLPISPQEQRADKSKGKGRGKGRGRGGRGKGRAKKVDVEDNDETVPNDEVKDDEVENEEGDQHVPPLPKKTSKASQKKSKTPAPSVPTGSSANAVENSKETEGGRKRKSQSKSVKGRDTTATKDPRPSKATSSKSPKVKGATKKDATEEEKAKADKKKQISRKSSAYHTAKRLALREGKSQEEALALAKAAPRHMQYISCTNLHLLFHNVFGYENLIHHSSYRSKAYANTV